jgi:hypothetical protein
MTSSNLGPVESSPLPHMLLLSNSF